MCSSATRTSVSCRAPTPGSRRAKSSPSSRLSPAAKGSLNRLYDGPDPVWHWGPTDPSGFAALAVSETLMHTFDITAGLGVPWHPPARLCKAVLARLFPGAPDGDPVRILLCSTGRADIPGRERLTAWISKTAVQ